MMTPGNGQMDCNPGLDSDHHFAESGVCDLSVTRDQSYGNAQSPGLTRTYCWRPFSALIDFWCQSPRWAFGGLFFGGTQDDSY